MGSVKPPACRTPGSSALGHAVLLCHAAPLPGSALSCSALACLLAASPLTGAAAACSGPQLSRGLFCRWPRLAQPWRYLVGCEPTTAITRPAAAAAGRRNIARAATFCRRRHYRLPAPLTRFSLQLNTHAPTTAASRPAAQHRPFANTTAHAIASCCLSPTGLPPSLHQPLLHLSVTGWWL